MQVRYTTLEAGVDQIELEGLEDERPRESSTIASLPEGSHLEMEPGNKAGNTTMGASSVRAITNSRNVIMGAFMDSDPSDRAIMNSGNVIMGALEDNESLDRTITGRKNTSTFLIKYGKPQ